MAEQMAYVAGPFDGDHEKWPIIHPDGYVIAWATILYDAERIAAALNAVPASAVAHASAPAPHSPEATPNV